jgi:two-component system CheB/CheR fusion protein
MGNALHILDRVEPASEPAARARAVIARQFGHLARLVNDLLDATRIASGKVHVQRSHLELSELVRRTVEDHRSLFVRAGVDLSVRLQEPLWVDGDPVRLSQVVSNLLANAAKFTNPGGKVEVSVRREPPATATVTVQDDGVGMAPEILARLFEPFAQGDETLDRSRGGLGLGLALAKGLVELHGGAIEAHSDGVGRGSTFTVHLPLAARDAASPDAGRAPATAPPRRILVVEDNVDAAETLRDLLRLSGHTVEIAHDGPAGIAGAAAFRPDLVLCDVGLPGMNGYEVARTIRATASGRTTTLVALTGYGSEDDRRRAFEAGFDGHLVKPVSAEQLQSVLLDLPRASPATRS